jgi:RNA polymerase sigma factor (sigma-70 family)
MATDGELLRRYVQNGAEDSFGELLQRHVNLVYSAALRQVHGDVHLAQDVAQCVFSDLARKARSLLTRDNLAGWLYTSTHFAAAKAVRREQRRRQREQEAAPMHDNEPPPDWEQLRPLLDSAMHRLKESDRQAILMRYFEKRSLGEIALQIGLTENAARMRVERALDKLRLYLSSKGATTSATLLASALSANAIETAPAGVALALTNGALTTAAGTGMIAQFINLFGMTKVKTSIVAAVLGAGAAATFLVHQQSNEKIHQLTAALQTEKSRVADLQVEQQSLQQAEQANRAESIRRQELIEARQQANALRQQLTALAALRQQSSALQAALQKARVTNRDGGEPVTHTAEAQARVRFGMSLGLAALQYASDHDGKLPNDLSSLGTNLLTNLQTNLHASEFELVYHGSRDSLTNYAHPGAILMVRERQPWKNTDGKWVKAYVATDGSGFLLSWADGQFEEWEKRHILTGDVPRPK